MSAVRAGRVGSWACWLLVAVACGGIAQEGGPRSDDPFNTFEPQQPGRRGGGRRFGGDGPPPPSSSAPAPAPAAGLPAPLPPSPRPPVAPPATGAAAAIADAGSARCDGGSCEAPPVCEPGAAVRCTGAELVCTASDGSTVLLESCANSCLCEASVAAGRCVSAGCAVGEARCSGNQLELCNPCQNGFDLLATCASAEACNPVEVRCDAASDEGSEPAGEPAPQEPAQGEPAPEAPAPASASDAGAP